MTDIKLGNWTQVTIFTIQCFSDNPELQVPFFTLFLFIYLIIITGNVTTLATIISDSHLHTPMYIFLCSLSFLDISYASTTLPKLLDMLITQNKTISFVGCMTQLYFFMTLVCTEFLLLAVMAYDRYVAVCHPLHYAIFMSLKHCANFLVGVCSAGIVDPAIFTYLIANLSYCSSNDIDHFFCDVSPVLKLTCSDTSTLEILIYINGAIICVCASMLTLASYVFIISTILKISTSQGRQKSFSTCTSHLTCVIIFYGTITYLNTRPIKAFNPKQDKFFALLYTILIPVLNPIIYTLKNKAFTDSLRRLATRMYLLINHEACK